MTTHFMSDPHFGDNAVEGFRRPFGSGDEHDDAILACINRYVAPKDTIYFLGDFAKRAADIFCERIKCEHKHLIWGNHDKNSYARSFKTVQDVCEIKIGGHRLWLSHYPHFFWPASHRGSFHLYGHVHAQEEEFFERVCPGRRSLDATVDNAYRLFREPRPFNEHEIIAHMLARPGWQQVERKAA